MVGQSKAWRSNGTDALLGSAEQVVARQDDLQIPNANNQAERVLHWANVQQKISGSLLSALAAVFHGQLFLVAWVPEVVRNE